MPTQRVLFLLASLSLLAETTETRATVLPPGSTVVPDAQSNPLTDPTFTVLATTNGTYNAQFQGSTLDSGTYTVSVVREASGTLDFVYKFTADPSSQSGILGLTVYNFGGVTTDVGYVADPSGDAPDSATRLASGSVISFAYSGANAVTAGDSSDLLIIRTNARDFAPGLFSLQGGATDTVAAYQPVAVPEPSALALSGIGGLALIGFARRRRALASA